VVLFIDDDVVPDADLVRRHVENYEDPAISGVGGSVRGGYDLPDMRGPVGTFRPADGVVIRNFGAGPRREVQHLPGGNMSFRRGVFERIGGFEPAYGGAAIGEETDFCLRAVRAGFRLVYDPSATLDHLHLPAGGCRTPRFDEWLFWHAHHGMLFLLRHARRVAVPLFVVKRVLRFALFSLEHASPSLLLVGLRGLVAGVSTYGKTA
ncbi:MAG: glycosyltransferase family 2 protein, partial [Planctomycetes bacterium]|nr:glycosyltransferase family 2 protein [Planctomycetota bacterium]